MLIADIARYYDERATKYTQSFQRCGWKSSDSQLRRFWALSQHFSLSKAIVLDAGCGDGEFYKFLDSEFPTYRYIGVDISKNMIENARVQHPGGLFFHGNVLNHGGDYDYVIASGTFSHKVDRPIDNLIINIQALFDLAQVALSITLLSSSTPDPDRSPTFTYYRPSDVLQLATKLTPYFSINHSYAKNDMCLTLFHR